MVCRQRRHSKRYGQVRERFQRYQLTLETAPRHGMKLFWRQKYRFAPALTTDLL